MSKLLSSADIAEFQKTIYSYYEVSSRSFPWRFISDPYAVLVSEIMLQQTQTERVVSKYTSWMESFPTAAAAAAAPFQDILALWSGLGYNRRARFLHQACKEITERFNGIVPDDPAVLRTLSGIGPYTACAVSTFAYSKPNVFIETNIRSVYLFFFFAQQENVHDKDLIPYIERTLDTDNPREWYYALMDYGAQLKQKVKNPNRKSRSYVKQSKFEGSVRQVRGAVIKSLISSDKPLSIEALTKNTGFEYDRVKQAALLLCSEGLIMDSEGMYSVSD